MTFVQFHYIFLSKISGADTVYLSFCNLINESSMVAVSKWPKHSHSSSSFSWISEGWFLSSVTVSVTTQHVKNTQNCQKLFLLNSCIFQKTWFYIWHRVGKNYFEAFYSNCRALQDFWCFIIKMNLGWRRSGRKSLDVNYVTPMWLWRAPGSPWWYS